MDDIILKLIPKENITVEFLELVTKIANGEDINLSGYEVFEVSDKVLSFKEDIVKYLLEHGFHSLIEVESINEELITQTTPQNKVVAIFQAYLDKVNIDSELIIVDPYFYAGSANLNYLNILSSVLSRYINKIDTIIIITKNEINNKSQVDNTLLNLKSTLNIIHNITNDFHDRFWISNSRQNGVVLGTSFNGLGNRIALIDRLNISDVRLIVTELNNRSLI